MIVYSATGTPGRWSLCIAPQVGLGFSYYHGAKGDAHQPKSVNYSVFFFANTCTFDLSVSCELLIFLFPSKRPCFKRLRLPYHIPLLPHRPPPSHLSRHPSPPHLARHPPAPHTPKQRLPLPPPPSPFPHPPTPPPASPPFPAATSLGRAGGGAVERVDCVCGRDGEAGWWRVRGTERLLESGGDRWGRDAGRGLARWRLSLYSFPVLQ